MPVKRLAPQTLRVGAVLTTVLTDRSHPAYRWGTGRSHMREFSHLLDFISYTNMS